jgi:hypothetical protein
MLADVYRNGEAVFKRLVLTGVAVALSGVAVSSTAIGHGVTGQSAKRTKLTTTIDGKKVLPLRIRWLATPPGKASAVTEVRFLIDGKLRWVEHHAPFNYGSDDGNGHLGWLVTSWLSPGRHRFTTQARLTGGRKVSDTVVARVIEAPAPPAALAGRWRRTVTDDDLVKIDPALVGNFPAGSWDRVFDRVGTWDLDPQGSGIVQLVRIDKDTIRIDAPVWITPFVNGQTTLKRYGHDSIAGFFCREDGPVGSYRWSVSADQLTLTPIDEPCVLRQAAWAGTWTRVG